MKNSPEDILEAQLLLNVFNTDIPSKCSKANWGTENKLGFILGLLEHGEASHKQMLTVDHSIRRDNLISKIEEGELDAFINEMFDIYIFPFHKSFNKSSNRSTPVTSQPPSRSNSGDNISNRTNYFKQDLLERDGGCLFCWDSKRCHGAHIIAKKNINFPYDESAILSRAGLENVHQIQNGLLLCVYCHSRFNKLEYYVDVVAEKLVVKVVNHTNDITSYAHQEWISEVATLNAIRQNKAALWGDVRRRIEENGEMALYFIQDDEDNMPNRNALEFHKTACLIWRMAGGAEDEDEDDYDDDEDDEYMPVEYISKNVKEVAGSSDTLIPDNSNMFTS